MDEISIVMEQFVGKLKDAIDAEVRRQVGSHVTTVKWESTEIKQRKPYAKSPPKACPVTGVLNTHRRFSYLMPEARTPENLAKYRKIKA